MGGSSGLTCTSTRAGPGWARAVRTASSTSLAFSTSMPRAPQDLAEGAVVVDHHLDREVVAAGGVELGHQHGEAAVADEGDALAARMGRLGGDRVGEAGGHGGQVPGQVELAGAAGVEVPGRPGGDGARVGAEDGVVGGVAGAAPP